MTEIEKLYENAGVKKLNMHQPDYLDRIEEITDIPLIICFKCGYPKSNEEDKILYAEFKSYRTTYGKYTDLAISKRVYDIEFRLL